MPRDQFNQKIGLAPAAPTVTNEQADPALDVAKSAGANLGRGAIDALGAPGDVGALVARGAEAAGVPEGARQAFGGGGGAGEGGTVLGAICKGWCCVAGRRRRVACSWWRCPTRGYSCRRGSDCGRPTGGGGGGTVAGYC